MSESLMYGAIIAVAAVILLVIGLFIGYQHAYLSQKCKDDESIDTSPEDAHDEVFAHELASKSDTETQAKSVLSSNLTKRPNANLRSAPILRL